jgi:hypothetical protein
VWNRSENKYGTGKSVGDRFAIKILNLKFMMMSHNFSMHVLQVKQKGLSREDK